MTTRIIETKRDLDLFTKLAENMALPFTITVTKGRKVSYEQHKLEHLWHLEASQQLQEYTADEYRGYCKAHFGIPIMCENEDYREAYDRIIRPLDYEKKIEMMQRPLDYPVTRLMTTKQKASYLDKIFIYYTGLGVVLTQPIPQNEGG